MGVPIPETEVEISEDGEILTKSPAVFIGYYKMPEETEKTLKDGWVHSGDAVYFDEDGQLIVIDWVKDVMTLHDGTKFSPQFVENKLKFSPYVGEDVVRANEDLPPAARMKRFILLHKELDSDDEELTRTRKVRRGFIAERYKEIVDALYGEEEYIGVDTTITYQDGRTADIRTKPQVMSMKTEEEKAPTP